jgi:hypothetical protein
MLDSDRAFVVPARGPLLYLWCGSYWYDIRVYVWELSRYAFQSQDLEKARKDAKETPRPSRRKLAEGTQGRTHSRTLPFLCRITQIVTLTP